MLTFIWSVGTLTEPAEVKRRDGGSFNKDGYYSQPESHDPIFQEKLGLGGGGPSAFSCFLQSRSHGPVAF